MLIAQARRENLVLMTVDAKMEKYAVKTLWCGR
jgi:PIN domain nuclease of toxin-antitoxin system